MGLSLFSSAGTPRVDETAQVNRARSGDSAAFEELYRRHAGRIYALCLRMTANTALAEDCAQEAFVRAWEKLHTFEGASAFGTWLHRIAVNEVLAVQRKDRRRGTHLQLVEEGDEGPATAAARVEAARDADFVDLERAIGTLPEGARNVFVLTSISGFSHEETAQLLGIAVGTSKAQLHRARNLLARSLSS